MTRHLISDAHEWINEIPTVPKHSIGPAQSQSNLNPTLVAVQIAKFHNMLYIFCFGCRKKDL